MRLFVKNRLLSRLVYDEANTLVCIARGHSLGAQKTVESVDGAVVYETRITNLNMPQERESSIGNRKYIICKPGNPDACYAAADLAYASSVDTTSLKRMSFKPPLVDRMILHLTGNGESIIVQMQKDGSFRMTDRENNPLGHIQRYHLFKGYQIDYHADISNTFIAALFELTRYLIKENELEIV